LSGFRLSKRMSRIKLASRRVCFLEQKGYYMRRLFLLQGSSENQFGIALRKLTTRQKPPIIKIHGKTV